MTRIKVGDPVIVISGQDKGKKGVVKQYFPKKDAFIIEGVNFKSFYQKPSADHPEGGILRKEAAINACKVMFFDTETQSASRLAFSIDNNGKKHRMVKKTKQVIGEPNA